MAGSAAETLIGAVVLAAATGFLVYAANTADISDERGNYELVAKFRKAEGISVGADVRIAGVKVGSVRDMTLDRESYRAVLTLSLEDDVRIPSDSSAEITTATLLGDSFIAIEPGFEEPLPNGGEIEITQGSVNVGDLIGKFIHSGGDDGGAGGGGSN